MGIALYFGFRIHAIQVFLCCDLGEGVFLGENFKQGEPEDSNTTTLGTCMVLKPKALHPLGCSGSQVV